MKTILYIALLLITLSVGVADAALRSDSDQDKSIRTQKAFLKRTIQRAAGGDTATISRGRMGRRGPRGPRGHRGRPGAQGAPGTFGSITTVTAPDSTLCGWEIAISCSIGASIATCPAGTTVIGGGFASDGVYTAAEIRNASANSYGVVASNEYAFISATFHAEAYCAQ